MWISTVSLDDLGVRLGYAVACFTAIEYPEWRFSLIRQKDKGPIVAYDRLSALCTVV